MIQARIICRFHSFPRGRVDFFDSVPDNAGAACSSQVSGAGKKIKETQMNLPVVDMAQTGQNIRSLRQQRGITVRQLQGMLGFATPQAIYNWQHGVSLPTVDNLVALAAIFSVPVETILEIRVTDAMQ